MPVNANGKEIVDQGSGIDATSQTPDVNKPPIGPPANVVNTAPAGNLGTGKTTRTTADGSPVMKENSRIDSSLYAHPLMLGGVASSTYLGAAWSITQSNDVLMEGGRVVRRADYAMQNGGNTMGQFAPGMLQMREEPPRSVAVERCTLISVTGQCTHERPLGSPDLRSNDGDYLEVLLGDVVDLTAVRHDITVAPPAVNPSCPNGKVHTEWRVRAKQYPFGEHRATYNGDVLAADSNWVLNQSGLSKTLQFLVPTVAGDHETDHREGEQTVDDKGIKQEAWREAKDFVKNGNSKVSPFQSEPHYNAMRQLQGGGPMTRAGRNARYRIQKRMEEALAKERLDKEKARVDKHNEDEKATEHKTKISVDLTDMLKFWRWYLSPPEISIRAKGCSGAKSVLLKVFPKDEFEFKLSVQRTNRGPNAKAAKTGDKSKDGMASEIVDVLNKFEKVAEVAKKMATFGGFEIDVDIANSLTFVWALHFEERAKDGRGWGRDYTKSTVGLDWKIRVDCDPLVGVSVKRNISLLSFASAGIGEFFAAKLRDVGLRTDIVFSAHIGGGVGADFGMDIYDETKGEFNAHLDYRLYGGIEAVYESGFFGTAGIEGGVTFTGNVVAKFTTSDQKGKLLMVTPEMRLRTEVSVKLKAFSWFNWELLPKRYRKPAWGQRTWEGQPLYFWSVA